MAWTETARRGAAKRRIADRRRITPWPNAWIDCSGPKNTGEVIRLRLNGATTNHETAAKNTQAQAEHAQHVTLGDLPAFLFFFLFLDFLAHNASVWESKRRDDRNRHAEQQDDRAQPNPTAVQIMFHSLFVRGIRTDVKHCISISICYLHHLARKC